MQTFTNKTLNHNWYEDRLGTQQPAKMYPEERHMRDKEKDISLINATGMPQPLKRIKRCHKHDTQHIILDDGFRETTSENVEAYVQPQSVAVKPKEKPMMVSKQNIERILAERQFRFQNVRRELGGPKAGFGATIEHFGKEHEEKYFKTTNQEFLGEERKIGPRETMDKFEERYNRQAGAPPKIVNSVKINAGLIGECYKKGEEDMIVDADLQERTEIQRSWMYKPDEAVQAAARGLGGPKIDISKQDNALSLPLGEGAHTQELVINKVGAYKRLRTDITMEAQPGLNFK